MRILWITNRRLDINEIGKYGGGWLTSLMNHIIQKPDIELTVCYTDRKLKYLRKEKINNVLHCGIPRKKSVLKYDKTVEKYFLNIIKETSPDIIHIHGTENANGIAAMNVCKDRTYVVSIQGLIGYYAEHYVAGVPVPYCYNLTLRDFLFRDGPISKGKKFAKSSWYEKEVINRAKYIMSRTSWDTACVGHLNPNAVIYKDTRVLRPVFYRNEWTMENCTKHRIFVGNGSNQIKGLHFMIKALPLILKKFPDTMLHVGGYDFLKITSFKEALLYQTYWLYIKKLIRQSGIEDRIVFTGVLGEEEMCREFINANVFVLPSIIENSPNVLAEAAALGVPTIASYIAGVPDIIENGVNGYLYSYDEYYIMADRIISLFEHPELAEKFSIKLKEKAKIIYDQDKNTDSVYQAYVDIMKRES